MRHPVTRQNESSTRLKGSPAIEKPTQSQVGPHEGQVQKPRSAHRNKLGLALAGGGFRASLFHLGVLRRMADLDLLRHVDVISTVSGGSIVGALYVLYLKKHMQRSANLSQGEYVKIVNETHETLVKAIKKNLRTRLFCNPLGTLRVLLTQHSLGRRMARLYERYIYRSIVDQLKPRRWWQIWRPGKILLRDIRINPGGNKVAAGIETYNAEAERAKSSKIPSLILNATSLNSGGPFRFSSVEIGDPKLGYFRFSEISPEILPLKELLEHASEADLKEALGEGTPNIRVGHRTYARQKVLYAAWWRARRRGNETHPLSDARLFQIPNFPGCLPVADFGSLRKAKLAAWFYQRGPNWNPPVTAGIPPSEQLDRFWAAIKEIDKGLGEVLHASTMSDGRMLSDLLEFVLELYYLRSAEIISARIMKDLDRLSLGDAVGASACFPPVFPPFTLLGVYDDLWVTKLGLTDGGVYDNVGISTLMEEGCTHIIASDTGGVFNVMQRVSTGRIGMSSRIVSILMDDLAERQLSTLRDCFRVSHAIEGIRDQTSLDDIRFSYELRGLSFFRINSEPLNGPGMPESLDYSSLARIRTDLDVFGDIEIGALEDHGYAMADRYLRKYLGKSPFVKPLYWHPAKVAPIPLSVSGKRLGNILEAGQYRFFRSLRLNSPISWVFTLSVWGALIWKTWNLRVSVRSGIEWIGVRLLAWIEGLMPWLSSGWTDHMVGVGTVLVVLAAIVLLVVTLRPQFKSRVKAQYPKPIRWFLFLMKWIRSYVLNIFWIVGGAPLWIALAAAGVAWISYVFYDLPFICATRNRSR